MIDGWSATPFHHMKSRIDETTGLPILASSKVLKTGNMHNVLNFQIKSKFLKPSTSFPVISIKFCVPVFYIIMIK